MSLVPQCPEEKVKEEHIRNKLDSRGVTGWLVLEPEGLSGKEEREGSKVDFLKM